MAPATTPRIGVIIAAGGTGSRFGGSEGKQLATVAGRPVVVWAIEAAASLDGVVAVVVVCHPDRVAEFESAVAEGVESGADVTFVAGGATRQASVAEGLAALPDSCDIVVVHDGARPVAARALFERTLEALLADGDAQGAIVGHPTVDTLKHVHGGRVIATPDRTVFWAVQTPQIFRAAALRRAYAAADAVGFTGTDDSSLIERLGGRVLAVEGPRDNVKVTHAEDLTVAQAVLEARGRSRAEGDVRS